MCLHLIATLTIYVLPKFIRGTGNTNITEKRSTAIKNNENSSSTKLNNCNTKNEFDMEGKRNERELVALANHDKNPIEVDDSSNSSSGCSSFNSSLNDISHHIRKTDTNYLLKDLISKEVNKIKDETDNLSNLLKEKIEAANIEGLIDKTVNGIVELKDDLMRMNEPEVYGPVENLRKRNASNIENALLDNAKDLLGAGDSSTSSGGVDAFLKKEIDAIKKEVTVIPAVLSNANSAK